jgi:hypothetical protein
MDFIIRSPAGEAGEEASQPRLDKGKGQAVEAESPTARARGVLQPPVVIQEEVPDKVVVVTRKHHKVLREIAEEINELWGEFIAADKRLEDLEENAATLHRNAREEHTLYVRFRERLEGRASKMRALIDALAEEDEDEPEIIQNLRAVSWGPEVQEVPIAALQRRESTTTLRTERAIEAPEVREPSQRFPRAFSTPFMHGMHSGNLLEGRTLNRSLANTVKTAMSTSTRYFKNTCPLSNLVQFFRKFPEPGTGP